MTHPATERTSDRDTMDEAAAAAVEETVDSAGAKRSAQDPADDDASSGTKKRKRKYSKGLRDIQRLERGLTKASHRMAVAVEKGVRTYRRRSEESARARKDGALRDAVVNLAVASSETIAASAKVPLDLAEAIDTKRIWKRVRPILRAVGRPMLLR